MFWRFPYQKTVPPMPEVKPPLDSVSAPEPNYQIPTPPMQARPNEFRPSLRFHAFCAGCDEMEPVADHLKFMAGGRVMEMQTYISCKQYDKCKAIAEKIEDRLRG